MRDRDLALLILLAVATAMAVVVYRIRRHRGSSSALATFAAGCAFGALCAVAEGLLYDAFFPPRAGIGLERIVTPIVTMFVCVAGSALLAGIVYALGGRAAVATVQNGGSEARRIMDDAAARVASRGRATIPLDDWRTRARHAATER